MKKNNKVYDVIASRIIEAIENGALPPWVKPWNSVGGGIATNLISKKAYRGVNALLLSLCSTGYDTGYFVSYKQCKTLGGTVRKGEHGFPIVFWSFLEDKDTEGHVVVDAKGNPKRHCITRFYTVFNVGQCDGLEGKYELPKTVTISKFEAIQRGEDIIATYLEQNPELALNHGGDRACYSPSADSIQLPTAASFIGPVNYYATAFHEIGHSTGHASRLNRKGITEATGFGSDLYAKEELIAELTCTYVCGVAGFEDAIEKNSAAYLKGWMEKIKEDPALLINAAQGAQKAADYILLTGEEEQEDTQ